jgi:hypothetical protein
MSRLLPFTRGGQMIFYRPVFALVFVILSVLACLAAHRSWPEKGKFA